MEATILELGEVPVLRGRRKRGVLVGGQIPPHLLAFHGKFGTQQGWLPATTAAAKLTLRMERCRTIARALSRAYVREIK